MGGARDERETRRASKPQPTKAVSESLASRARTAPRIHEPIAERLSSEILWGY
jgi:hypothetical protein